VNIVDKNNKVFQIDEADQLVLSNGRWFVRRYGASCRVTSIENRKTRHLARVILGVTSKGVVVDHIDGNPLNNCRQNLRICSQAENSRNRSIRQSGASGFRGVCWNDYRYRAEVAANGRRVRRCGFTSALEAAYAYDKLAVQMHGDFASLNFPCVRTFYRAKLQDET
jgi:hypothetical protein